MHAAPVTPSFREVDDLPSPRGLPLLGNLHQLPPATHHLTLERWATELGTPYVFRFGTTRVTVWDDIDLSHTVLRERPYRYRRYAPIERILKEFGCNGLFSIEGDGWESQRRLVMQALSIPHIKTFYPTLAAITERLRRRWEAAARAGAVVDMLDDLKRFTVDVTSALALGDDPNTLENGRELIQQQLAMLLPTLMARVNSPFAWWHYVKLPRDRQFDAAMIDVHRHIRSLMARTRARMREEARAEAREMPFMDLDVEPRNLLEAMLALRDVPGSGLTDDEVAANVLTMLVAGEETTATSIAWALLFLGADEALQERVAAHARTVLGDAAVCPGYAAMRTLDLCEALCTEASRLHPVAPYLSLEPVEDVRLRGVRLPAGTKIFLLHRPAMLDPRNFAAPERYDPDRWLHEHRAQQGAPDDCPAQRGAHEPHAYLQFGAGPRVCPGRHLAAVEMRLVISMLTANFTARLAVDASRIHETCAFTVGPSAMPMRLALRARS
ncbi:MULTISPECIES: cytochrome P450 [unclassified Caballeronia]|uniref:cytochrome P450 n=1 Tax=unclassified Caballeronia TaxID=2646786 RepID=UPI0028570BAC|nr:MULTISPECIES: cytochrome P450 [unclassified Caballeronia]MDR5817839.1 cytochrome P450 [Caballeronia sp. LZ033]MDR5882677.1 cytochrome P450 [Caballeronia sp. LZ032]